MSNLIEEQSTQGREASDNERLPFDMQSEIMKWLPVESLIRFRNVSKGWKAYIEDSQFIKNYRVTTPRHHLLVQYNLHDVQTYTSIIDNNPFPQPMFPLTAPESLSLLRSKELLNSVGGLFCFYGDVDSKTLMAHFPCAEYEYAMMAVLWNPSVPKSVGIVIPSPNGMYTVVGFGVSSDTNDPKIVKISVSMTTPIMWKVEVFTLSTRVWKTVFEGEPVLEGKPFKLGHLECATVFANGCMYFRSYLDDGDGPNMDDGDEPNMDDEDGPNIVFSFDLKNEIFGKVGLPNTLVNTRYDDLRVAKVNESLGLLKYYDDGPFAVCDVWKREDDDADKEFTNIYNIRLTGKLFFIVGFRNNGDFVMELDDDDNKKYTIGLYEPSSGRIYDGIPRDNQGTFFVWSYMETLLLLDQKDSIIH